MPKIIPMVLKMKWLQLHEDEGDSAAFIVKGTEGKKPSLKTVKDGIDEARRWRDGKLAHAELLKDALRKHHEQLIAVLEDILSSVQLPAVNLDLDLPILLTRLTTLTSMKKSPKSGSVQWRVKSFSF